MNQDIKLSVLVRDVFIQLGSVLLRYVPTPSIIDLFHTQLFEEIDSCLSNRVRYSIYCDPHDIATRLQIYNEAIHASFHVKQTHDLKIWNVCVKHLVPTQRDPNVSLPRISDLIDIQQLLMYLCFISFTKQSNHLIPLCCDDDKQQNTETALVIDINIGYHLQRIKAFMNKIGNTFQHVNEENDSTIDEFVGDDFIVNVCMICACTLQELECLPLELDAIELMQKRALSMTSMIAEMQEIAIQNSCDKDEEGTGNEDDGMMIYECSAVDDEDSMNYDFKCHAIWKAMNGDFDSIKEVTSNLPPASHSKIRFDMDFKYKHIEFGNFYGVNNDTKRFEYFDLLKKYVLCPGFVESMEWYASDIEVQDVNEALVKCYNMCFGLLKNDRCVRDTEISYNLKFVVWKGLYKSVDELASLEAMLE
eukprot:945448_1